MMLETARLRLRRFRPADLEDLAALLSDEKVMEFLEKPYTKEESWAFLRKFGLSEPPAVFAAETRDGAFAGYVIWHPYDEDAWELGWVLGRTHWGKGYAGELTEALIAEARAKKKDLVIECAPGQAVTGHIAEKHGFSPAPPRDGLVVYRLGSK